MKNAIVTGGTQGIGLAISKKLMELGYYVFLTYAHNDVNAENAKKDLQSISANFEIIKCDQSTEGEIDAFCDNLLSRGINIDCIVCNAGMTIRKKTFEITSYEFESVMRTCVISHFILISKLHNAIPQNSRIIFTGSMMGILPHGTSLPYGVSKSAVHSLSQNLVKDFEGTGTTVNAIAPGFVETHWQKNKPAEIRNNIYNKTAIKRFATPEEIAQGVQFCIENGFVNGSIIEINGGYCFK